MFFKTIVKKVFFKIKYNINIPLNSEVSISSTFEGKNLIGRQTKFDGTLGRGSYIGSNAQIVRAKIGRYCSIANNVVVASGNHPMNYVSQHPMFYSIEKQNGYTYIKKQCFEERIYVDKENRFDVIIGNDVWIGNGAIILGNIKIGDGAVIGAGAVVTRNIPSYAVVGGVPAKIIKYRFNNDIIKELLNDKWWNKSEKWLAENAHMFKDIDLYMNKISINNK